MSDLTVIIAGAGLGGLTLAQSLRRNGIGVAVYERDASPWERPQGYRLHLDADAITAAREVLPRRLAAVFEATSQVTAPFTTILGTDLSVLKRLPTGDVAGQADLHANVDRATLRQILLDGLEDVVHYGKAIVGYESTAGAVVVRFGDGTAAEGSLLVGADGIRSVVRRQRAPQLSTMDAGVTAIYGRIPLAAARAFVPDETLEDIFTIASDERKVFLGLGSVRFPTPPARFGLRGQDDYVVCVVGGRPEHVPPLDGDLRRVAAGMLRNWPGRAAALVMEGEREAFFTVAMHTSVPGSLGAPTNVTLLGDAVHAMTPTLGRGANVAMRDGAALGRVLLTVAGGQSTLEAALADYEREMTEYGFAVVREAARIGGQRMAQNPLPEPAAH